jgi:phosphoglycolate phosphatase-like HAD superfamily hydrolase
LALFIGDKLSDLKAAKAAETNFLGRAVPGLHQIFPENIYTFDDFTRLKESNILGKI